MEALHTIRRTAHLAAAALALPSLAIPAQAQSPSSAFEEAFSGMKAPTLPLDPDDGAVDLRALAIAQGNTGQVLQSLGSGEASYYGRRFHGRITANGETFDMNAFTAAHRTLPFGSMVRVTNPRNGRSVIVRINDRGPYVGDRVIDLSRAAAEQIGLIQPGFAEVQLALVAS